MDDQCIMRRVVLPSTDATGTLSHTKQMAKFVYELLHAFLHLKCRQTSLGSTSAHTSAGGVEAHRETAVTRIEMEEFSA